MAGGSRKERRQHELGRPSRCGDELIEEIAITHSQVIPQAADLAALVFEVVDELAVLSVLAGEDLLELKDGGVDGNGAVELKDSGDGLEDVLTQEHLAWVVVFRALGSYVVRSLVYRIDSL